MNGRKTRWTLATLLIFSLALAALLMSLGSASAQVAFVVTKTTDNAATPEAGMLRDCINKANLAVAGPDVEITFDVDYVTLVEQLPALTRDNGTNPNIIINGLTSLGQKVIVYNSTAPAGSDGLVVQASRCTVENITFQDFTGSGIVLEEVSDTTINNVRCYHVAENAIAVYDGDGTAVNNTITGCQIQECATAAPGPVGSSGDYYGIKLDGMGTGSTNTNIITGTFIYGCGNAGTGGGSGIGIFKSDLNTVDGCCIGSANTFTASGNRGDGIVLGAGAANNTIGGTGTNIIMSNVGNGIRVTGAGTSENSILFNYIGLSSILQDRGNTGNGIFISSGADNNILGSADTDGIDNFVCYNDGCGIQIDASSGTKIFSNAVGTDTTMLLNWANSGSGIEIKNGSSDTVIGGDNNDLDPGLLVNYIGYNLISGIKIAGASDGNWIKQNNFSQNNYLGIDIDPVAEAANPIGDPLYPYGVAGNPNLFMPYPVITDAGSASGLAGTAVKDSVINIYYCDDDIAGYGQGEEYIGTVVADVDTGDPAAWGWSYDPGTDLTPGSWVTATATDTANNTSEFCANKRVADEVAPAAVISIDSGATVTNSQTVSLGLLTYDDYYSVGELEYEISNYADFHDATWTDVPSLVWTTDWELLSGDDGTRTVYFQVRDPEVSAQDSDDIFYKAALPTGSLQINGGSASTGSPEVTLGITASDTYYDPSDLQMRISNYSDQHDSTWQAYTPDVGWALLAGNGNRTVYVQLRDPLGNTSGNIADSIYLDTSAPVGSVGFKDGIQGTTLRDVDLVLTVKDSYWPTTKCQMEISESADFTGSSWQAFQPSLAWTLSAGTGEKTVYARFRDATGNVSAQYSAKIFLDTGAGAKWYLAEGTNAWGFSTYITIENPNDEKLTARITYMRPSAPAGKGAVVRTVALAPTSQTTVDPGWDVVNSDFSTVVECLEGKRIAVDRTMSWTGPGAECPGAHSSIGVSGPVSNWYLAEGSSNWGFETWVLVQNPNAAEATVNLTYMAEGKSPRVVSHKVAANSRASFSMMADAGKVDASIQVSADKPVIAERSMYFDNRREGTESVGAMAAAGTCYLAEGTTAWGFTTYVLVQNPNAGQANVTMTYMTTKGPVEAEPFAMTGRSRKTVRVNDVLKETDFSVKVASDAPIIAERSMYWETEQGRAAHNTVGLTAPHGAFYLPDGQRTAGWETWTLVQNPNSSDAEIQVKYLAPNGDVTVKTDVVKANSRKSYSLGADGAAYRSATEVICTNGLKIMVERSMYCNDRGTGTGTVGGWSDDL